MQKKTVIQIVFTNPGIPGLGAKHLIEHEKTTEMTITEDKEKISATSNCRSVPCIFLFEAVTGFGCI